MNLILWQILVTVAAAVFLLAGCTAGKTAASRPPDSRPSALSQTHTQTTVPASPAVDGSPFIPSDNGN